MTDQEYITALEELVKEAINPNAFEWYYWDVVPQKPLIIRQAYARATGDKSCLHMDEE